VSGNAGGPIMPPQLVTFLPIRAPGPDPCRLPRICSRLRVFSSFLGAASNVENEPGLRAFRRKNFSSFCASLAQICYIEIPDRLTKKRIGLEATPPPPVQFSRSVEAAAASTDLTQLTNDRAWNCRASSWARVPRGRAGASGFASRRRLHRRTGVPAKICPLAFR